EEAQPQPRPALLASVTDLVQALEDVGAVLGRYALAGVGGGDPDRPRILAVRADADLDHAARGGELQRVVDQVSEDLDDAVRTDARAGDPRGEVFLEADLRLGG